MWIGRRFMSIDSERLIEEIVKRCSGIMYY